MTKPETNWTNVISVFNDFQSDTKFHISKLWTLYVYAIFLSVLLESGCSVLISDMVLFCNIGPRL